MKIKEVAIAVCTYLNKTEITDYLTEKTETPSADILTQVDILTRLTNLVINELACSYVPMKTRETVSVINGKFLISSLTKRALKILSVMEETGEQKIFMCDGENILTYGDNVEVEYSYLPENYGLDDTIGYGDNDIPLSVLAFGVCAEYCLTEWRFEEAVMWRERYSDALKSFTLPTSKTIKGRAWL